MLPISSPCIKRCDLDAATGLCSGCGRTLAEIGDWAGLTEAERRTIMAGLPARIAASRRAPARRR